eukprot:CAMPEP_0194324094 /NCGR_PEP_ID=MMETSP0171-20130528/26483_1 /TAXON_ID=218684 /ORGANISM="Corethron pennatum, Strain L29A3" /LENGTH=257 /DNA_ID=CAMNT_0039082903 /DNA_START=17 /DNA_END=787 /DNA_ORIENTATION=+
MSLSFVKSAVLTSTDGISHDTETSIETSELSTLRSGSSIYVKPLFEQLQENKESAQEDYDNVTASLRGTRTLDEEDVAHLAGIEEKRHERERLVRRAEEDDVRMFHAARMERTVERVVAASDEKEEKNPMAPPLPPHTDPVEPEAPIVVRRKRRRVTRRLTCEHDLPRIRAAVGPPEEKCDESTTAATAAAVAHKSEPKDRAEKDAKIEEKKCPAQSANGLGGLLGCYGSDGDDSNDDDMQIFLAGCDAARQEKHCA